MTTVSGDPGLAEQPFAGLSHLLPRLAVNVGWLKLMGEPRVEQRSRQKAAKPVPCSHEQTAYLERKRQARKLRAEKRGRSAFLLLTT